jgi:RNA polymerase sigma-70 factor, ECF subfamily
MAGPFILPERGASQMRRGLRWMRPGIGELRDPAGAEDRTYASPESLFMDEYERLARAISLISRDPDVARDAVQEVFARLCREWPTVSGYQHQAAWVRKVALNLLRDQQRQSGRRARLFVSLEQMQQDPEDAAWDSFASVDIPADGELDLWRAVRQLPEKQKTAIGLFYIADLNVSEVAAAMGVSQGTVKRHLDRARNTLRTKMEA